MAEPYCVELTEPEESVHGLGWFVRALRTELGVEYFLSRAGTVEPDNVGGLLTKFYFTTEAEAYIAMKQYFEDWNEPFPFQSSYDQAVHKNDSQTMKFI